MKKCRFSIFTPTCNRRDKIKILFSSLCSQTYKDFEWIVVDNGENKIEDLILDFSKRADFRIIYLKLEHKGINRAYNKAINYVNGEMVFKVDDDDFLLTDSLAKLNQQYLKLDNNKVAAISGLRSDKKGRILGGKWNLPSNYVDIYNFERDKYGLGGDKAECYFTSILKRFLPFPVFESESYTDESILYNRIANAGYKIRFFNEIIYVTEYLSTGITKNLYKNLYKSPNTYGYMVNQRLNMTGYSNIQKLKLLCRYLEVCKKKKMGIKEVKNTINCSLFLIYLGWVLSSCTKYISRKEIK